ncbi:hypothetical protein ACOMHN_064570 [Nucella lapillus]
MIALFMGTVQDRGGLHSSWALGKIQDDCTLHGYWARHRMIALFMGTGQARYRMIALFMGTGQDTEGLHSSWVLGKIQEDCTFQGHWARYRMIALFMGTGQDTG